MNLDALGRELRREQRTALPATRRRAVRDRLLSEPAQPKRSRKWLVLVPVAAVVALALLWRQPSADPLTFRVAGEPGTREAFVSAPMSTSMPLTFSDGSRVELARGSSARVDALSARGATLRLEHGHADVHVIHRDDTDWQVEAGPYTVHVVGTRFAIRWDARSAELEVAMRDGRVVIDGPDGFRTTLEGRERLRREGRVRRAERRVESAESVEHARAEEPVEADPVELELVEVELEVETPATRPDWRSLAQRGRHTQATRWLRLEELRSPEDLRLAANTLRRAGDARENRAWERLHHRHGDRDAAFHLARNAFHSGELETAERWLDTYLEAPGGRFEREARGRRLELLWRRGDPRAREEAERYLQRFAEGAHAELAHEVVSRP